MKAIILAAGMGTRLKEYTKNLPKCMLNFKNKSLIEWQVNTLRKCNINDITIVKGYMPDKIQISDTKYYINKDFATTNMVESLFCAEREMNNEMLVCYSDILYEKNVINRILESQASIGVTVDTDYWDYWSARLEKPEEDIESLVIDDGRIIEIGNPNCTLDKARVRYVGLIKFSKKGIDALKQTYHQNKDKFRRAYMTDILQTLIDQGNKVEPILINRGWLEFDNVRDYELALEWDKQDTLSRFCEVK